MARTALRISQELSDSSKDNRQYESVHQLLNRNWRRAYEATEAQMAERLGSPWSTAKRRMPMIGKHNAGIAQAELAPGRRFTLGGSGRSLNQIESTDQLLAIVSSEGGPSRVFDFSAELGIYDGELAIEFSFMTQHGHVNRNRWQTTTRSSDLFARRLVEFAKTHFESMHGQRIRHWLAEWTTGRKGYNHHLYQQAQQRGHSPSHAAWETWSGPVARDIFGFRQCELRPGSSDDQVLVRFF